MRIISILIILLMTAPTLSNNLNQSVKINIRLFQMIVGYESSLIQMDLYDVLVITMLSHILQLRGLSKLNQI
jgi:hypothetical protein